MAELQATILVVDDEVRNVRLMEAISGPERLHSSHSL